MAKQQTIRAATVGDLKAICQFTDYWLAGRGLAKKAPGSVNDYFISPRQHKKYIEKYTTYIATENDRIIGWSVIEGSNTMIHLLVAGDKRGQGLGLQMLEFTNPQTVRSKSNQSSGNPTPWYERHGYVKTHSEQSRGRFDIDKLRPRRPKIIDVLRKES